MGWRFVAIRLISSAAPADARRDHGRGGDGAFGNHDRALSRGRAEAGTAVAQGTGHPTAPLSETLVLQIAPPSLRSPLPLKQIGPILALIVLVMAGNGMVVPMMSLYRQGRFKDVQRHARRATE